MNKQIELHIKKIKNYLILLVFLHIFVQMAITESFLLFLFVVISKFHQTEFNYFIATSFIFIFTTLALNIKRYKNKTKEKYFIYRYLEKNFPALSSSLSTVADTSLKNTASEYFLQETEKHALKILKNIEKKEIEPIFKFDKLKFPVLMTGFLWILILFPFKNDLKNMFYGKTPQKISKKTEIISVYNLKLTVYPPEYLKKEKETIEGFDGKFKVYTGSMINIEGETENNYNKCIFVYGNQNNPCEIKNSKFKIKHKILMNSLYHIEFMSDKNKKTYKTIDFEGEIIPDAPPKIKIAFPKESLVLNYNDTLEITAQASDDIALKKITFKYQIDDEKEEAVNIENIESKSETVTYPLKLSEFEKGDTITYYFEAYDNDTVLGPKIATSRKLTVEIKSEMKIHENFLKELEKTVKKFTTYLADHLELDRKVSARKLNIKKFKINENILKLNNKFKLLLQNDDPLLSVSSKSILRSVNQKIFSALIEDKNSKYSAKLIKTLEDTIIYITDILDRERIEIINQLYKSLKTSKNKLKDLINEYKINHDKETKKKILKEIRNIKRKIKRILEKLSQLSADIDSKYINKQASKVKKMAKNMANMEELLEKGELDKLLKQLENLEKELNEMIEGAQDKKEGLMKERDEEQDRETQKFINDLKDLIFEQEQLYNQSKKITSKLTEKIKNEMKKNNFLKKNINLLEESNNYLFNLDKEIVSNETKENISRISEGINLTISFLKGKNLITALETLYGITSENLKVKYSYENSIKWLDGEIKKQLKDDYKYYMKAENNRQKVMKNIEKLLNKVQNTMNKDDIEKLKKLSKAQKNLKNKLKQLQNQAQKLPLTPPNTNENLQKSESNMAEAEDFLKRNNPNMAKFKQNAALENLKNLQKEMQKQRNQMNKNSMKQSGKTEGQKIKIPDENYKGPKELREDILKAMKKEAPKGKEKTVNKYFKNIIKR